MRFVKLRLAGFKSFVEPTEFLIESGLTGIVGPNGCGKSNLLEAMRWVMGESSSRNMRAADMDDVIFSGSGGRASRQNADVMLTVDEVDGVDIAGVALSDTYEISRRIERGQGSTYRVNGREVRARDVQIMFADASTGARSPAMVRQGQISELIAARPSARRAVLEEASGIAGLHGRRNEAEIRLRAAEQNLERLGDVQATLKTQLDALERQSRQATRYRNLSAEIRSLEAALSYRRWREAHDHLAEAERALTAARSGLAEAATAQSAASRDQAVTAAALAPLRQAESEAGAALGRSRRAAADAQAELARIEGQITDLRAALSAASADREREARLSVDARAALERLTAESSRLEAVAAELGARQREERDRRQAIEARLVEAEAGLAAAQSAHAAAVAARDAAMKAWRDLVERRRRAEAALSMAVAEHGRLAASAIPAEDIEKARSAVSEHAAAIASAEARLEAVLAQAREARSEDAAARARLSAADRERAALAAEIAALERLVGPADGKRFAPVLDAVRAATGFERALAAALGEDLDLPVDEAAASHWTSLDVEGDPALPDGAEPLLARVEAPPELHRRLAQTGVVDRALAPDLLPLLRTGQVLVSREGDVWRWDGVVAAAEAPTPAARRLEARNRLAGLKESEATARAAVDEARVAVTAAASRAGEAETAERGAREAIRAGQKAEAEARARLADLDRRSAGHAARLAASDAEVERRRRDLADLGPTAEGAQAPGHGAGAGEETVESTRAALEAARHGAEAIRRSAIEARSAEAAAAHEDEARRRRLASIAEERLAWERRVVEASRQSAVLESRASEAKSRLEALVGRPEELATQQRELASVIARQERERREAGERLAKAETVAREADLAARAAIDRLAAAREAIARAEERLAAAEARRQDVEARIRETFEVAPALLATIAGISAGSPDQDPGQIERRLERCRQERERMGPVNLRADEEMREMRGRSDELAREQEDVIEAVKRLRAGIAQIDEEARARLKAAFEIVDGHFRALFTQLFGGGEAELRLVDSDDPLQAGLEIYARPPGKKPSTMSLLSGGEQALTAIALIFAVFLTNPAPVCVLDEVDAPLDDANVERWCDLLADMAGRTRTRFLVVTHNPITMARMNRLYGVTMAERGVSQLVSVDLDVAESLLDSEGVRQA